MRICMILEGCYPYVRGGVSSWMHSLITSNPQHEYVLWVIAPKEEDAGNFKYEIPSNVVEIREVFLDSALKLKPSKNSYYSFTDREIDELKKLVLAKEPDWNLLFRMYNEKKVSVLSFLMSEEFLNILLDICKNEYPHVTFTDFFHTVRSMFLPILYLLSTEPPKADVYHATSTGYGGMLGALGAWKYKRPYIVTEHGIYTREREEEILRAKWVVPQFRQHWINMFYMLAHCAYDRADSVTALFKRYSDIQLELGCEPSKRKVIENGIRIENFANIPPKVANGYIDITAVVRIHPIKDIKTMIHAFFSLKQRVPNVRLHILGDTDDEEYRRECVDLIKQLEITDIDMPGNVNVSEYFKKTDFTVLSSISEGQPLAVLESFAAGRPCVTTDVGCCRNLIEGNDNDGIGAAGIIVPPMHSKALSNAMEVLATNADIRNEMAVCGKKRAETYYQHENMVENYNKNYEEVLKKWRESALN